MDKIVPSGQVPPLTRLGCYLELFLHVEYGVKPCTYLRPRTKEKRRVAAAEKQQDQMKRIVRELFQAQEDSILR